MFQFNRFDVCEAYYLFLSHYHEGQGSEKYQRLSHMLSYFTPSPLLKYAGLSSNAKDIYDTLVEKETGVRYLPCAGDGQRECGNQTNGQEWDDGTPCCDECAAKSEAAYEEGV